MPLSSFHPIVQEWFRRRFGEPTQAQALGWPAIAQGRHTLITAPTGSGKTLAGFLACIDGLVRAGLEGELPQGTQVVYVSPLKALSNDIHRNLEEPLAEIAALAEEMGTPLPEIRVAVRTGDTSQSQRQAMAKRPPHILITTPESLYILLTAQRGRQALKGVRTLILDEIHAVVDDKRGSHLALSVERLCALAEGPAPMTSGPVTRIGLSATIHPLDEVARFLVGSLAIGPTGEPDCLVVDAGRARELDMAIEVPELEIGPIATHEYWGQVLDRIAALVQEHKTTLVFVNTRRLVERVAYQLEERLGKEAVAAHHGSLSRHTRLATEQRLKAGEVKVCVATASLELGIDIGVIDLVCQIGSPRSIALLLQRVGRSGHFLGGTPKGRLFPLTRDELLECIALLRAMRQGKLDQLSIPPWPLDVLAQQIVAACASEEWEEDALYELCRRAYPYRDLSRERYDQVLDMLSQGTSPRLGRRSAYLHRDAINHKLRGRPGSRLAAITSGGAIPDNADYKVIAEPEETFIGTVNEDFAVESLAGDVFLLGNHPWRIRRVEQSTVRVEDAQDATPSVPFWLGEAPGRTPELSQEVAALREELDAWQEDSRAAIAWLMELSGVGQDAAEQAVAYIQEGKRVLGMVPTQRRVVAERFFDETGGMQLVIHAPFGARINRACGYALRKQICRTFDFELQAAATDDGINLSLGPQHSFPLGDIFRYLRSRMVKEVLEQAVLQGPIFTVRWRWDVTRSLAVLRQIGGRRVPPPLQRMKCDDLLAAVFPAQIACQDNAMPGDIEIPDHPLVYETMRDCLTEAMDVEGFKRVLMAIEQEEIEVFARDTPQPSVFSHQILNAMPYAFLDDAPLEERRARAVALRRALPEDAQDLGALDVEAIARAAQDAWPVVRSPDELHDALMTLGMLLEAPTSRGKGDRVAAPQEWQEWFAELVREGRAVTAHFDGFTAWVATESVPLVAAAIPGVNFHPTPLAVPILGEPPSEEEAITALVRGRVECSGPFTAAEMGQALGLRPSTMAIALARLEAEGTVLQGSFTPGRREQEYCDRRILARIHRDTITRLRRGVQPVPTASFIRFLFRWQHTTADSRLQGEEGLLEVVEQLQGYEAPAGAWEADLLSARVAEYTPLRLDNLCVSGEVVWGRLARRTGESNGTGASLGRSTPVSLALREDLPWLLDGQPDQERPMPGGAQEVVEFLQRRGASFLPDIILGTRLLPSQVEEALRHLAAEGLVTADSFSVLRGLVSGATKRVERTSRFRRQARPRRPTSRWSLLHPVVPAEDALEARAAQLLRRYGVVFPEVLTREPRAPRWRDLLRVYRRAEARGEIRAGRFVSGFMGEQFALPEAVELLREVHQKEPSGELVKVSACDPLNVAGVVTPGPRVPALLGNSVVFQDGVPVASLQSGEVHFRQEVDESTHSAVQRLLQPTLEPAKNGRKTPRLRPRSLSRLR